MHLGILPHPTKTQWAEWFGLSCLLVNIMRIFAMLHATGIFSWGGGTMQEVLFSEDWWLGAGNLLSGCIQEWDPSRLCHHVADCLWCASRSDLMLTQSRKGYVSLLPLRRGFLHWENVSLCCSTVGYHQPSSSSILCHAIPLPSNCLFHKCKMSFSDGNLTTLRPRSFSFPMSLASNTSVTLQMKMKASRAVGKGAQSQASSLIMLSLPHLPASQVFHLPQPETFFFPQHLYSVLCS